MSPAEERTSQVAGIGPGSSGPVGEDLQLLTGSDAIKVVMLGDSAVGKSKLVERFLLDNYKPHQLSTYALTLYRYNYTTPEGNKLPVDLWDTAGQERFSSMHSSYYYRANACIMVFDVTRKVTYKNLETWCVKREVVAAVMELLPTHRSFDSRIMVGYDELQQHCKGIPTIVVANKIDIDSKVTSKSFAFATKRNLPFFFVSASDGTNVVKIFEMAILAGLKWKLSPKDDFYQEVLDLLGELSLDAAQQQQRQYLRAVAAETGDGDGAESEKTSGGSS